ncbi:MAG: asparaginase [Oscillospiraceae bacterium]|nr:asparaginase [Oscillospiraceae bacterium]
MKNDILLISTGGTISCVQHEDGAAPEADISQLERFLTAVGEEADILPLMNIDSTDMDLQAMGRIASACDRAFRDGAKGIVITHGTDTMAYTAAYLTYALRGIPIPVMLTGSQLPFDAPDSDAPSNLSHAFAAARRCLAGVHIVFGSKVLFGDRAMKSHSRDMDAFTSPDGCYSAAVEDGEIRPLTDCSDPSAGYRMRIPEHTAVGALYITPYTSPEEIVHMAQLCPDGLVLCGYGLGGIPSRLLDAIGHTNIPILVTTQCAFGGVDMSVYAVGNAAVRAGAVPADMTTEAALCRLMFGGRT